MPIPRTGIPKLGYWRHRRLPESPLTQTHKQHMCEQSCSTHCWIKSPGPSSETWGCLFVRVKLYVESHNKTDWWHMVAWVPKADRKFKRTILHRERERERERAEREQKKSAQPKACMLGRLFFQFTICCVIQLSNFWVVTWILGYLLGIY